MREEAKRWHKRKRDETFQKLGLNNEPSPLTAIHESLCIPVAFPGDVAHSEFKGIARQVLNILFTDLLKPQFHEAFAREFTITPSPPTWARLQNIHKYLGSYSMQEFGRASMITPVVLRRWLLDIHLRVKVLSAIDLVLLDSTDRSSNKGVNFIVHCFALIARLNAVIMGPHIRKQDRRHIDSLVRDARERMQDLIDVAVFASNRNTIPAEPARPSSQPTSPLNTKRRYSSRSPTPTYKALYRDEYEGSDYDTGGLLDFEEPLFGEEEEVYVATVGKILKQGKLSSSKKEKKRLDALQRKKYTPNVHTILHVKDTIAEFGSARNVTTWSGEDKHK